MKKRDIWSGIAALGACALTGQAHAYSAFDPASPHMFGDWGGRRTALEQAGISFDFGYTGEAASNVSGGYDGSNTTKYADQFAVGALFDLDRLAGIPQAEFQVTVTNRNGHSVNDRINHPDALIGGSSVQEVQGRGPVSRLTEFWYRQRFFDNALMLKLGRISFDDDFATIQSNFQNLAFGNSQPGNWGNHIYNWPISQWAAVVRANFTDQLYTQVGAFNINESNLDNDNGFDLRTSGTDGTLFPLELGYTPQLNGLPGAYKLGYYYGNVDSISWGGREQSVNDTNSGLYYVLQQQVSAHSGDTDRGLSLFSMGMVNHGDTAGIDRYIAVGATYQGPFDARPQDDMGLGVAYLHVNDDVNDFVRYSNSAQDGRTLLPEQGHEINAELYYGFHLTNYLVIRPNLQYMKNPSAVDSVKSAWVVGSMVQAQF